MISYQIEFGKLLQWSGQRLPFAPIAIPDRFFNVLPEHICKMQQPLKLAISSDVSSNASLVTIEAKISTNILGKSLLKDLDLEIAMKHWRTHVSSLLSTLPFCLAMTKKYDISAHTHSSYPADLCNVHCGYNKIS